MKTLTEVIVSPYSNNIIDLVGCDYLMTFDGNPIIIERSGILGAFHVVAGDREFTTDSNIGASAWINSLPAYHK